MFGVSYWVLPFVAALVWLGTLLSLVGVWAAMGKPHYAWEASNEHLVPYISDIAATSWGKPTFITGSAVMVVLFDLAFISERWLRHKARLEPNYNRTEKILSSFAILFAIIGAAGLVLLTIFDTKNHHSVHNAMLVVFMAGYIISAIFICAEYQRLGIHFRQHRILRISFWIKLSFILVEFALALAFGVLADKKHYNGAAVGEWTIALFYILYVLTFIIDFLPAVHTKHLGERFPSVQKDDDVNAMETQAAGNNLGGPVYSPGGETLEKSDHDSGTPIVPMAKNY